MPPAPATALSPGAASEVLRYWQALLRHQEALSARPRARRNLARELAAPHWSDPARGQDYAKLPWNEAAAFLVDRTGHAARELDAEGMAFFEHWLAHQYRGSDDGSPALLVSFPTLHLPRDELGGVLRFPVTLRFRAGDRFVQAPTSAERRAAEWPPTPTHLELASAPELTDGDLPFFIDLSLLRETLRVPREDLDALFAELRAQERVSPRRMLGAVCDLLERPLGKAGASGAPADPGRDPRALLTRLNAAVASRLAQLRAPSRVYPLALLVLADRSRATWHVQRDLEQAREAVREATFRDTSPLWPYLSGQAAPVEPRVCLGRWPRAPLTSSQRSALESSLGSRLAAVQGPPGTGKTTLILNAVVHQLIEKARSLAVSGVMGEGYVLVTSTNNRAVDTVLEPLGSERLRELPLALRLGSREVLEKVTARDLRRFRAALQRLGPEATDAELERARAAFASQLGQLEAGLAARTETYRLRAELAAATARAATATAGVAATPDPQRREVSPPAAGAPLTDSPALGAVRLRGLKHALMELSAECERAAPLGRIAGRFAQLQREHAPALASPIGAVLSSSLPPKGPAPTCEDWEEALEHAIGELEAQQASWEAQAARHHASRATAEARARVETLELQLARTGSTDLEDDPRWSSAFERCYELALELRTTWLRRHRTAIAHSLETAARHCERQRSLRGLLDSPKGVGIWLRQLFPVLGCTLLSLGNALAPEASRHARVIVDEAGQCHPAYAVSALLRGRSALVIGDVHQLEPVVGLGPDDERRIYNHLKLALDERRSAPYRVFDDSGSSAQSLADAAVGERPTLRDHFRCQPAIAALSEAWCGYGMVVRTAPASRTAELPELAAALVFQAVDGEQERVLGSWCNPAEMERAIAWVRRCLEAGIAPSDIGVITPFRGQSEALFRGLRAQHVPLERWLEEAPEGDNLELFARASAGVAVGTVHRFQGGERSIILLSTTVTRSESLGFLDDRVNLLNVAATRAKEHLIVLGHSPTLLAGRYTRELVERSATS